MKKDGHYIVFRLNDRELLSRMTIMELLEQLPENEFIQVHRSWVVAINRIQVIQRYSLEIDGKEIPIGDSFREEFFKRVESIGS